MFKSVLAYFIICTSALLFSCNGSTPKEEDTPPLHKEKLEVAFEERVKNEIAAKLSIPGNEKYELKIYKEHLNGDDKEDAIITVNRLNYAMDVAAKDKTAKRAEFGYMGPYNYFFFYDGKLDRISVPLTISSSAKGSLGVKFENIQSQMYKDVMIEYRIRNSCFRNYYLIENGSLLLVFQWKVFDMVGTDNYEANYFSYQPGTLSLAKDIVISKGKIKNYSKNISDVYAYNPEIEKEGDELYRFFYDPREMAYMTKKQ